MWKYGYRVATNHDGMGAKMIDLCIELSFNYWELFRKFNKTPQVTIYIKDKEGKRNIFAQLSMSDQQWWETEHIPLSPGEELFVAFEGPKLKANSFIARYIRVLEHYTDKDGKFRENRVAYAREIKPTPVDVFNHRWK